MLGVHTKQVNAYGRRQHRIINVSENLRPTSPTIEPDSTVGEYSHKQSDLISPIKARRSYTPKIQPGAASPARPSLVKRSRLKRLTSEGTRLDQPLNGPGDPEDEKAVSSSRHPLSSVRVNAPDSPVIASRPLRKKAPMKGSSGLKKSFDAFIDVEISIIDSEGNVEKKEHRVSRAGTQSIAKRVRKVIQSDSEDDLGDGSHGGSRTAEKTPSSNENIVKPSRSHVQQSKHHPYPPRAAKPHIKERIKPPFTQRPLSPVLFSRQLTPIRRGAPFRHQPPSPTQSDISLGASDLELEDVDIHIPNHATPIPSYLIPLLTQCAQEESGPHEFSAFIESFPFDSIVHANHGGTIEFRKIGEASYSEVFGIGGVVLKIIPLNDEEGKTARLRPGEDIPALTDAKDVLKEIRATKAMGDTCPGFVELLRTYVVRGKYPELLLRLWDEFDNEKGSESVRPDCFGLAQTYAIIVLPNGGPDLENFIFSTSKTCWRQACSIFWQVTKALSVAEDLVSFEHRDLHWGQILIKDSQLPNASRAQRRLKSSRVFMDDPIHGVTVTIIDLGLSRMDNDDHDTALWTVFDEEVFMGDGDYQFDVYRMMRNHTLGAWQDFKPLTNVMWLHYLVLKLLKAKGLKAPAARKTSSAETSQEQERESYECLLEIEKLLRKSVAPFKCRAAKKIPKTVNDTLVSAEGLMAYAVGRQWISSS